MKPTTRDGILRGGFAALVRLLILIAAGVSAYLLSVSWSGGHVVGCGPGSACDAVLQSRWAYVFGLPVSVLALLVDLALLLTTFSCGAKSTPKQRRAAWEILAPCSVLVLGSALWFVALQAFVLHRFCPWCMTAHAGGALAAVLLLTRLPVTDARERRDKDPALPRATVVKFAALAVLAVALLGVAQSVVTRQTYTVSSIPLAATNAVGQTAAPVIAPKMNAAPAVAPVLAPVVPTNPAAASATVAATTNVSARTLDLFGGRIRLDLAQVPVWGSPDAPFKIVSLYDYTCHHCRDMHPRVAEVARSFGDKLAVVSLPMPLDAQCNPLMRQTSRPQLNACQYAKLGLIVWRAKRAAIQPFDDWLFGFPEPPPLAVVTNKVLELIGPIAFDAVSRDPWIEQQIKADIGIFEISGGEFHHVQMPQFIIGANILEGTPATEILRAEVAKLVGTAPVPAGK